MPVVAGRFASGSRRPLIAKNAMNGAQLDLWSDDRANCDLPEYFTAQKSRTQSKGTLDYIPATRIRKCRVQGQRLRAGYP